MFTGLIEEVGSIITINAKSATICANFTNELNIGDSVSVNGTCLTVTNKNGTNFTVDISPETFNISTWKFKKTQEEVNLERALKLGSRLDGHIVSGHVDTIAKIIRKSTLNEFTTLVVELNNDYKKLVVQKGSITIDGISLTIAKVYDNSIEIAVIPQTLNYTTLSKLHEGDFVNIEFDILAKYIEKNLSIYHNKTKISMEFLEENGFL